MVRCFAVIAGLLMLMAPLRADVVLFPSGDTYINPVNPGTNFGILPELLVNSTSGDIAFIQFNLASVAGIASSITHADLRV